MELVPITNLIKIYNQEWLFSLKVEACATGSLCDGCSQTAEQDGVVYCCAKDCNSGSLDIHTENGNVVCECRH